MGSDLGFVTHNEIRNPEGESSTYHLPFNRGLCTFLMNAKNTPDPVMSKVEAALGFNMEFLLEPEYYNENEFGVEDYIDMGFSREEAEKMVPDTPTEPEGFVAIEPFLTKVKELQAKMTADPEFEARIDYDREWWLDYFKDRFAEDIQILRTYLEIAQTAGETEFSLSTG